MSADNNLLQWSLSALFEKLHCTRDGLSSTEAERRRLDVGPNEPLLERRNGGLGEILRGLANPLVLILLVAGLVAAAVGEIVNASIIVTIVVLSMTLNFVQTYRSHRAVRRLRQGIVLTATALRDGSWIEVPRREIVPGDIVRLVAGDLVPADARLIEAKDLHVQQAALTGESLPAEKEADTSTLPVGSPALDKSNVFLGTSVVSGSATALVVITGKGTAFGEIAGRLVLRAPETEFERGTRQFGLLIMQTVFLLVLFVFFVNAALRHDPFESLLFALALAVGLTPEFLPMITTVTLGQGALRMAREKVIVKNLSAIQNFGSMDVLCSDKTGTLTSGEMSLEKHLDPQGNAGEKTFFFAYLNSYFQTGVKNPIDTAILQKANVNPLDLAILRHDHPDVHGFRKLDEVPFDFERRRVSVVIESESTRLLIAKGAPENILAVCSGYEVDGRTLVLDQDARSHCQTIFADLSSQGYRVLAVAYRPMAEQRVYGKTDEQQLVLIGFLAFFDPPLEDASDMLQALAKDGVRIKILTGDNEKVAQHVCTQVGLDSGRIVLGAELEKISDVALAQVAESVTIFARVSPVQKNRIIHALKHRNHVVGFLGDGINDAPSLHAADVGISVASAVDVARDAADIILLEHDLGSLHRGILEGRKAFGNVMKYLLMGTSSNFGNMFSMAGASLFLPFLPMLPTQILLNNFLYDLAQITIPTDNVEPSFIVKPRRWDIKLIRNFMVYIGPISSLYDFLTFYALLHFFGASEQLFHTGWFVESLATQTLVIFVIRTAGNPLRSRPSLALSVTTSVVVLASVALPYAPLGGVLGFTPLPATFFLFLVGVVGTYLLLVEWAKRRLMRNVF
ncbi:MAG TPA: magnesium-translocating P-type ATPase [Acidobacteriota bacterium]|nr:magnesium-translocating P-type ATPase [Acidobacteriota bacterium]